MSRNPHVILMVVHLIQFRVVAFGSSSKQYPLREIISLPYVTCLSGNLLTLTYLRKYAQ